MPTVTLPMHLHLCTKADPWKDGLRVHGKVRALHIDAAVTSVPLPNGMVQEIIECRACGYRSVGTYPSASSPIVIGG